MTEFITPAFLENHSTDEVHAKMMEILPEDLDVSQGSHTWNKTRPTALVIAELCEFILPEVIKLIFPEWSYGEFLDGHAQVRGMTRRAATAATGTLTITGTPETVIPAGSLFSTASVNDEPSVDYQTLEEIVIPAEGVIEVEIECTQIGIIGNTTVNTIVFVGNNISGVTSVTNSDEVAGGTEEETDESLIERIVEYDRTQGDSFVGNISDYKRWALSVNGVGSAVVIPAEDTSGLVTIIVTDSNGSPATEQLCEEVYNYIMRPDDPGVRKAPVNAYLSVEAPETIDIAVIATVELEDGYTIESVIEAFQTGLTAYLPEALEDNEVKYTRVHAVLSATAGVNDFSGLQIGVKSAGTYSTSNIPITITQLPTVAADDLLLTEGTV